LYYNDDATRLFASLRLASPSTSASNSSTSLVHSLIRSIDTVLATYQLPVFYIPADPHISLCWTVDVAAMNVDPCIVETIHRLREPLDIDVHVIHMRIGNKLFTIEL